MGICTRITVRLTRDPESGRTLLAVFDTVDAATAAVSDIIAAGIVPAALEMLDSLMIQAVEQAFGFGFPTEAGTVLAMEGARLRWWTFAGGRANCVLSAALDQVAPELLEEGSFSNLHLSLRSDASAAAVAATARSLW